MTQAPFDRRTADRQTWGAPVLEDRSVGGSRLALQREVATLAAAAEPGEVPVAPEAVRLLERASERLAKLPGSDDEVASDVALAQQCGLDGRPEWQPKVAAVNALASRVVDPEAEERARELSREVDEALRPITSRALPGCADPTAPAAQQLQVPPRWKDLKDRIDELLEASEAMLTIRSWSVVWPERNERTWTEIEYVLIGQRRNVLDSFEYWEGFATAFDATLVEVPAGRQEASHLQYLRVDEAARDGSGRPVEEAGPDRTYRGEATGPGGFATARSKALEIVRLLREVICEVDSAFEKKHAVHLDDEKKRIEAWRYLEPPEEGRKLSWAVPLDPNPSKKGFQKVGGGATVLGPRGMTYSIHLDSALCDRIATARGGRAIAFRPRIVHFEHGRDDLSRTAKEELRAAVAAIEDLAKAIRPLRLEVSGHADGTGEEQSNALLAIRRANRVAAALETLPKGTVASVRPHGCGAQFAPDRSHRAEHRVAVIRVQP